MFPSSCAATFGRYYNYKPLMKRKHLTPLMLGMLALFSACESETVTPEAQVGLEFETVKTSTQMGARMASASSLAFTSGAITLSEVKFEAKNDDDADSVEVDFKLNQDVVVDFATGESNPDLSTLVIQPGTYEKIEVELELQDEGSAPAIVLNGTFTDAQGQSHPIRFEFNSDEKFEVKREGTVVFAEGQLAMAQVVFDPAAWFAGVSADALTEATKDAAGVIVISETQNEAIYDLVAEGLDLAKELKIQE